MHPPPFISLTGSARECYVKACGEQAYNDISATDIRPVLIPENIIPKDRARVAPHHDAESCFWVIMQFMVTAFPASSDPHARLSSSAEPVCNRLEIEDFEVMFDLPEPFVYIDEQELS